MTRAEFEQRVREITELELARLHQAASKSGLTEEQLRSLLHLVRIDAALDAPPPAESGDDPISEEELLAAL